MAIINADGSLRVGGSAENIQQSIEEYNSGPDISRDRMTDQTQTDPLGLSGIDWLAISANEGQETTTFDTSTMTLGTSALGADITVGNDSDSLQDRISRGETEVVVTTSETNPEASSPAGGVGDSDRVRARAEAIAQGLLEPFGGVTYQETLGGGGSDTTNNVVTTTNTDGSGGRGLLGTLLLGLALLAGLIGLAGVSN